MLFTGRLTAKAEVNSIKGDKQVINFTVAINQKWKKKAGEKKEKTAFIGCAYWRNFRQKPQSATRKYQGNNPRASWNTLSGNVKFNL